MGNRNKVGLVGAVLLGGLHLCWSVLVFTGVAQTLYDFVLWKHMLHLPLVVGPFNATAAVTLVITTTIIGYILGYVAATVWSFVHK